MTLILIKLSLVMIYYLTDLNKDLSHDGVTRTFRTKAPRETMRRGGCSNFEILAIFTHLLIKSMHFYYKNASRRG